MANPLRHPDRANHFRSFWGAGVKSSVIQELPAETRCGRVICRGCSTLVERAMTQSAVATNPV